MVVAAMASEWLWSEMNERCWAGCRVHCVIFHCCLFGRERIFVDSKLIDFHRQCCAKGKWFVVGQTKNRWSRHRCDPGKISQRTQKGVEWMGERKIKTKIHQRIQCAIPLSQCSHWINRIIDEFVEMFSLSFGRVSERARAYRREREKEREAMGSCIICFCRVWFVGNDARLLLNLSGAFWIKYKRSRMPRQPNFGKKFPLICAQL